MADSAQRHDGLGIVDVGRDLHGRLACRNEGPAAEAAVDHVLRDL